MKEMKRDGRRETVEHEIEIRQIDLRSRNIVKQKKK